MDFLEHALLEATDRESARIGQELHDHLCQHLLGAAFAAKALANSLPPGSPAATEADNLARLVNSGVQQTRELTRGLCPAGLDSHNLREALRNLAEKPRCRLVCEKPPAVKDTGTAVHLYRIAQEALTNALKHSEAVEIVVKLHEQDGTIFLEVLDNGRGFDHGTEAPRTIGIETMRIRARALGAMLTIDTPKDGGTSVLCALPKGK